MRNLGSQRSHLQKEGEEVTREKESKREKIKIKRLFCLEKCGKTEEIFTGNETPPVNQNRTHGHVVYHAAIKPSMQSKTPSATTAKKNRGGGEGADIYIYIYLYLYTCKYLIIYN